MCGGRVYRRVKHNKKIKIKRIRMLIVKIITGSDKNKDNNEKYSLDP